MSARYKRTMLATCCLPWREDYTLDEPLFRKSVRNLVAGGFPDLYVFGTAGEGTRSAMPTSGASSRCLSTK